MKRSEVNVCIIRTGGTNCDMETKWAIEDLGAGVEILHARRLFRNKQKLFDYHMLVIPGGFSYGDYVRAGAILARELVVKLGDVLRKFLAEEKLILGICNGFQVLIESGLLPYGEIGNVPKATLAPNISAKFECRWIRIRHEWPNTCVFTRKLKRNAVLEMPVAHSEGRFFAQRRELERLYENGQIVFKYCGKNGQLAKGQYPINPNGSIDDIAGICDTSGKIFGLMPHPERAYFGWQLPDWTSNHRDYGDGKLIFESAIEYIARKF